MKDQENQIIRFALPICLIEMGPGSVLHSAKIPFTGFFLSLNQLIFLIHAQKKVGRSFPTISLEISMAVSLFKSLSPVGKKITPMLAIMFQGVLYNLPMLFSQSFIPSMIGSILFLLWGFFQPLLVNYLIFGKEYFSSLTYFLGKLSKKYEWIGIKEAYELFALLLIFRLCIGLLVATFAYFRSELFYDKWEAKILTSISFKESAKTSYSRGILKDLTRPFFLISILITGLYVYLTQQNFIAVGWYLGRVLICAFIFFSILRLLPFEKIVSYLPEKRLGLLKKVTVKILKKIQGK